jgi:hypothetical protein
MLFFMCILLKVREMEPFRNIILRREFLFFESTERIPMKFIWGREGGRPGMKGLFLAKEERFLLPGSGWALRPTERPIQLVLGDFSPRVKRPGHETVH